MIDIFRLNTLQPGLVITENSEGDIILALGPPGSPEMTTEQWRSGIRKLCYKIARSTLEELSCTDWALESWMALPPAPGPDALYDYKAVSELTKLSVSTLRTYHAGHKMPEPYVYRGGSPLWLKDTIVAWLATRGK